MASLQLDDIKAPPAVSPEDVKNAGIVIEAVEAESSEASSSDEKQVKDDEWTYPHPTDFKISEHNIDEIRELKVLYETRSIGADY